MTLRITNEAEGKSEAATRHPSLQSRASLLSLYAAQLYRMSGIVSVESVQCLHGRSCFSGSQEIDCAFYLTLIVN